MNRIRYAYTDDKPRLLQIMTEALACFDEVELVFTARSGHECLEKLANPQIPLPEVILMDIEMDQMDGIQATREIRAALPDIRIVMMTVFDDPARIFEAILAGACGYLLKDEKPSRVVSALEDAVEGRAPMSPGIAIKALELIRIQSLKATAQAATPESYGLTSRELEILSATAGGLTYQEIADTLFISPKTVRNHIENIYRKLQVHSKLEAVQLAMKHKWIPDPNS